MSDRKNDLYNYFNENEDQDLASDLDTGHNRRRNPKYKKVPTFFNLKRNKKLFAMHHYAPSGTWQIDIMFGTSTAYFVAIEVNTRFLIIKLLTRYKKDRDGKKIIKDGKPVTYAKSDQALAFCLIPLLERHRNLWQPKTFVSDSEPTFKSAFTQNYIYNKYGIKHKIVYLTTADDGTRSSNHTSLSIIDRVIRTCKDYIQNDCEQEKNYLPYELVQKFVKEYNERPHSTLCKVLKRNDVTPREVHENHNLEQLVIDFFEEKNYVKRKEAKYFYLPENTIVRVYNPPNRLGQRRRVTKQDPYKILRRKGVNIYEIENLNTGEKEFAPRIWLDFL